MNKFTEEISQFVAAGELLYSKYLYRQSVISYWSAVRKVVFLELKNRNIAYNSTKEAIKEFVKIYNANEIGSDVVFIEATALLCEWDEDFSITPLQAKEYKSKCIRLIEHFELFSKGSYKPYYEILKEELNRHIEDIQYARSIQYSAATRKDAYYKVFLRFGFVISILGLSALLYNLTYDSKIGIVIGQFLTLVGVGLTIWPLIKDYSGQSMGHRNAAEEYNRLFKTCINWRTDYPDETMLFDAEKSILQIRNSIIIINSLSPVTLEQDYRVAQIQIENGAYVYDKVADF